MVQHDAWVLLPWDADLLTFHEHYFSMDALNEITRSCHGSSDVASVPNKALFIPSLQYMGRLHLALRWGNCDQFGRPFCDDIVSAQSDEGIMLLTPVPAGAENSVNGKSSPKKASFRALPELLGAPGSRAFLQSHAWHPLVPLYQYPGPVRFASVAHLAEQLRRWARGEQFPEGLLGGRHGVDEVETASFRRRARERARKWWYFTFAALMEADVGDEEGSEVHVPEQ